MKTLETTYTQGGMTFKRGDLLIPAVQAECLRRYVHRFTGDHRPAWAKQARPNGGQYPPQFVNDRQWLENTFFAVRVDGGLDGRASHCESRPVWPNRKAV